MALLNSCCVKYTSSSLFILRVIWGGEFNFESKYLSLYDVFGCCGGEIITGGLGVLFSSSSSSQPDAACPALHSFAKGLQMGQYEENMVCLCLLLLVWLSIFYLFL